MNNSILVTGASGFVGTHLVQELRARGEQVVPHSRKEGDLSRVEPDAQGIRHVYHLAARTYVPDSWKDPRSFYEPNVLGTLNVLEFCRKNGSSLTLLSSYVYGAPEVLPIPEEHPLRSFNPYGNSKILAEQMTQFYGTAFQIPITIVRAFNLYGPGQADHFLIPTLIAGALAPDTDNVTVDDDRPKRDYIFIADLIDLLIILGRRAGSGVYNAGSGSSASVGEVAQIVIALTKSGKRLVSRDRRRQDEVMDTVADMSRVERELNWRVKTTLEEGLRRTIDARRLARHSGRTGVL